RPRRRARQPAEGPLARDLQPRRHPRDRRDLLTRPRRPPRMPPAGDPGRNTALRPGPGRSPHLHRLAAMLAIRLALATVMLAGLAAGPASAGDLSYQDGLLAYQAGGGSTDSVRVDVRSTHI